MYFSNKYSVENWTRRYSRKNMVEFSLHLHNFTRAMLKGNGLHHLTKGISRDCVVHRICLPRFLMKVQNIKL